MMTGPALAQSLTIDLGGGVGEGGGDATGATAAPTLTGRVVQLFLIVTVLSMAPGIAVMITCFPFMLTVLAILRQGLGLQASPPSMLLVSLALFLTWYVMEPVFTDAWNAGISPLMEGQLSPEEAFAPTIEPFRQFMAARVDPDTLAELANALPRAEERTMPQSAESAALSLLIPAFMLSEIARAFTIGFMLFLPFVIIDLVVASILMSMGMMMVPPIVVSLPLKLAFFVVADGWALVAAALVRGYS
ncbi:MAG: flagellar type III secretion system pore protein FliP [Pseudomonadota bacterium]